MLDRETLESIVQNPSSTSLEKSEARALLERMDVGTMESASRPQSEQDAELESYFAPKRKRSVHEACEEWNLYHADTQKILDDHVYALLCGRPPAGAVHRWESLLARTTSDIVRKEAESVLRAFAYYFANAEEIDAYLAHVPEHLR